MNDRCPLDYMFLMRNEYSKFLMLKKLKMCNIFDIFCTAFIWRRVVFFSFEKGMCFLKEQHRDKTNRMACAPSEDSDQPGHPPSLIRVFAVRLKKAWVLSYPLSAQRRL